MDYQNENMEYIEDYSDGSPKLAHIKQDGKLIRQVRWHENGQMSEQSEYQDGKLNGKKLRWYEDGGLKSEDSYSQGIPEGPSRRWYPSGTLKEEAIWQKGKLDGHLKQWDEDENLILEAELKGGNGKYTAYHANGQKKEEYFMKGEIRDGESTFWDENGEQRN